ncbi:MAG TPA: AAA family ATPase [Candidatus Brocadiia bacterium]|nr:AAA family ATPase [Candidatus Brocadiia bacterium]
MSVKARELRAEETAAVCDPAVFNFETTAELPTEKNVIGQPRGQKAVDLGVKIESEGFNIFVTGPVGTGRMTTVKTLLEREAAKAATPDDWCYVQNFEDKHKPRAVRLPSGRGKQFQRDMEAFIEAARAQIPRAFEGQSFRQQTEEVSTAFQIARAAELANLEKRAQERGFAVQQAPNGVALVPTKDGKPLSPEEFGGLDEATRKRIEEQGREFKSDMGEVMQRIRKMEKEAKEKLEELAHHAAAFAVEHVMTELRQRYAELPQILEYIGDVEKDILRNVGQFREAASGKEPPPPENPFLAPFMQDKTDFSRYTVNLLVDNSRLKGAPVVVESNPTFNNLIGRIEHRAVMGALLTDFTMIGAGALHRANGGYLVIEVMPLLRHPFAWDALKRALKDRRIKTEEINEQLRIISTTTLEPEPIPLDVKVIIVGSPMVYYMMNSLDEDLRNLFKIRADFDYQMPRTPDNVRKFAEFIGQLCRDENLAHMDRSGAACVVEHASRLAADQNKLAITFSRIADVIREANYWARERGGETISYEDVRKALSETEQRSNRIEERLQELITDGTLRIDVTGAAIGQVNGLAVISLSDHVFGKPSRITARVFAGRGGVVNIEREAKMSGRIHNKGIMILTGYLGGKYAARKPVGFSTSIAFEQLYEEVDGDSASSTELYAIISALSELPLRQDVAVTGSVDQRGNIQPVGGVTEKVEGFFDACNARGLTGTQGVMIPAANIRNLTLRYDVRAAIAEGKFHIWAVETVEQGIELLTGQGAGEENERGEFPEGTVNYLVAKRLEELTQASAGPAREKKENEESEQEPEPTGDGQ